MAANNLSSSAQRVLNEVAAQLERYNETLHSLCAKIEVTHSKHGIIGPNEKAEQREERLGESGAETEQSEFLPLLTGTAYDREELSSSHPNELRVRATRNSAVFEPDSDELTGADLMFQREPARLIQAILHPPDIPLIVRLIMERVEAEMLFGYVNGVPLPVKVRMRMRSRGISRLRFDQETVTVAQYEPCT